MATGCGLKCVRRNFLFMMTGLGKGLFNIFVGTLLLNNNSGKFGVAMILGWILFGCGAIFIFLSFCKQMTDDDLQRAMSVNRSSVIATSKKVVKDNKGAIAKVAYDNRDVIAEVAAADDGYNNKNSYGM